MFIEIAASVRNRDDYTINADQITSFKPHTQVASTGKLSATTTAVVMSDGDEYLVEMAYSEFKKLVGVE